ncbi:MAG: hydrolase [Chitinivibrionales bacterium]|nr:hydrolase [Chitinivibrionales bacterium]
MKRVLCYGDSNTWGYNPSTGGQYSDDERWAGVLQEELGRGFTVIIEGLNGRTTMYDDPFEGAHKNGRTYLPACIESHKPLDLVIILLGTNDLKTRFHAAPIDVAQGAGMLAGIIQASDAGPRGVAPQVLLIAPPPFEKLTGFADNFAQGEEKSRHLTRFFKQVADSRRCHYLDAGEFIVSSPIDGIHLDATEHRTLAETVADTMKSIFSE